MDCGATCCCAPDDRHQDKKVSGTLNSKVPDVDLSGPLKVMPGPCVTSAPCGGALPTGSGPLVRMIEPADRSAIAGADPTPARSLLAPPASDRAEARPGSRLDEPPERLDDA
jgi:hypothetical protein